MSSEAKDWGLHWFRRDLRVSGNEALKINWKRTDGRTLGLFCFDSKFLSRPDFSHHRFAFFIKTLKALKDDLVDQGGDLLVIDCQPQDAFLKLLDFLKSSGMKQPSLITWNRDYEPYARQRDAKVEALLQKRNVEVSQSRDHLLFEPHEISKTENAGDFYQVYSPYSRRWFEKLNGPLGQSRLKAVQNALDYYEKKNRKKDLFKMQWSELSANSQFPFQEALGKFETENQKHVTIPIPEAGFFAAFEKLKKFKEKLAHYHDKRDIPSLAATSRFSMYLKNGSLTVPQIIASLDLGHISGKEKSGPTQFVKELAWREFYYSILYHKPSVEKKAFLEHFENIAWENNETYFNRWIQGTTGFPIVDAGMRELAKTGWMHNRVRMIVASFLTKDLLIDWRWGENYFMKALLDGDLAPNNGGWQWAASTGCDPQPYFRIFNPWLQSAKFDPDGIYIKTFVKELEKVPAKALHNPQANRSQWGYPNPIVEHSVQRDKALRMYKRSKIAVSRI